MLYCNYNIKEPQNSVGGSGLCVSLGFRVLGFGLRVLGCRALLDKAARGIGFRYALEKAAFEVRFSFTPPWV